MPGVVFGGELNGARAIGAQHDRLQVPHHTKPVLQAERRADVDTEKVAQLIGEAAIPQIPLEAMRQVKDALVPRQPQRRGQVDHDEIGLGGIQPLIVVIGVGRCGRLQAVLRPSNRPRAFARGRDGSARPATAIARNVETNADRVTRCLREQGRDQS
jgi:hypothetical protein